MRNADTMIIASRTTAGIPSFHWDPAKACADVDPDIMHPERACDEALPVAVCGRCPFRADCARWAYDTGQAFGVYGGVTARERRLQLRAKYATDQGESTA